MSIIINNNERKRNNIISKYNEKNDDYLYKKI